MIESSARAAAYVAKKNPQYVVPHDAYLITVRIGHHCSSCTHSYFHWYDCGYHTNHGDTQDSAYYLLVTT
jgi:hypothetical protein